MSKLQKDFEIKSHERAVAKLKRQLQEAKDKAYFSSTAQARATIKELLLPSADILTDYYTKIAAGRASQKPSVRVSQEMLRLFEDVSAETIAAILLKSVLDFHGIYKQLTPAKAARLIGSRIEDEARFHYYSVVSPPDVVAAMNKRVNATGSSPKFRRTSTKLITEKRLTKQHGFGEDKLWVEWTADHKFMVGLSLLEVAAVIGLINRTWSYNQMGKKQSYVELTDEAIALHEQTFQQMIEMAYLSYPLLVPPVEWEKQKGLAIHNVSGGYYTDWIREQNPMCRGRHYRSEFSDLSVEFLNTISKTGWVIDDQILHIQNELQRKEISVGSFLVLVRDPRLDEAMPQRLVDLPKDHEERREWRWTMRRLHEAHEELRMKTIRTRQSVAMANEFLTHPRFYLSWSNDYRGRVYSQQAWLSPHATDAEKALIRFADGCKLDERGKWWAAQAVGSAYLGSRLNLEERVKWTYANKDLISAVAIDPYATREIWGKAKEPFEFLQLAIEWFKVVITQQEHIWRIGVGADATASGLQLLSSMLRDENGMKFSNVLPPKDANEPPQDAYLEVLRVAREMAAQDEKTQHLVKHLTYRGLGKTMMVQVYGACWMTIRDKVVKVFDEEGLFPEHITREDCCNVATLVKKASRQVFPKAFDALDWLKTLATCAINEGSKEFCWNTPAGDTIRLREFEAVSVDVRTSHLGKVRIPVGDGDIDTHAMRKALPPSFIHSYDAALLKLAFQGWTKPIAVIHDCLKVLPTDVDEALERVRRAFYKVCDGNPLQDIKDTFQVPTDAIETIPQGDGELDEVLSSVYLFN